MLERLSSAAQEFGVALDDVAVQRLHRYRELLLDANSRFNLTAITDLDEVESRLFIDSAALLPLLPATARKLLDLGSGGGIPGLVIAIARPDLAVDLVDATGKKVRFLHDTANDLGLTRVRAFKGRAEELGREPAFRQRYDVVTARAVARLVTLAELALPFTRVGGISVLPKGVAAADELAEARYAIGMAGGRARELHVPGIEGTQIVILDKVRDTPPEFPRRTGVPNKSPLLPPRNRSEG